MPIGDAVNKIESAWKSTKDAFDHGLVDVDVHNKHH